MSLRVVFDTNVVVSALLFAHGRSAWIRQLWAELNPLVSQDAVAELMRVLSYPKFQLESSDIEALLGEYLPFTTVVVVPVSVVDLPMCSDPDDQMFIDLAYAGHADILVSGDQDLLAMVDLCPFKILTPGQLRLCVREDGEWEDL